MSFFEKIKSGIKKTRENLFNKIETVINSFQGFDEDLINELEEVLIMGDVGIKTSQKICDLLKNKIKSEKISDHEQIKQTIKEIVKKILASENELNLNTKPSIILVCGVNGVGKTTTIGKLAFFFQSQNKRVLLAAADTFRAAAADQLEIWAQRANCDIVKHQEGSDPASVIFDAISAAKVRNIDVIICDTAGRLHNKANLMLELSKIDKVIKKELPNADRENLLILDANTGQNAINQTDEFKKIFNITGIILTKLDGTARGGVILAIKDQTNIPVKFIGIGENIENLHKFDAKEFANALFDNN